jgi:hypothetical protein
MVLRSVSKLGEGCLAVVTVEVAVGMGIEDILGNVGAILETWDQGKKQEAKGDTKAKNNSRLCCSVSEGLDMR